MLTRRKILKAIKDGQVNLDYVTCVDMANILYRLNEDMDTPFYVEMLTNYAGMGENYWKISYYNSHLGIIIMLSDVPEGWRFANNSRLVNLILDYEKEVNDNVKTLASL